MTFSKTFYYSCLSFLVLVLDLYYMRSVLHFMRVNNRVSIKFASFLESCLRDSVLKPFQHIMHIIGQYFVI